MGSCVGKAAFVTGASRGIGRAIAQRLAAEGASVVVSASREGHHGKLPGTLTETVSEIQAGGGKAAAVACDLSDAAARADLIERASAPFGPIDILVNNAASARMVMPSQATTSDRKHGRVAFEQMGHEEPTQIPLCELRKYIVRSFAVRERRRYSNARGIEGESLLLVFALLRVSASS